MRLKDGSSSLLLVPPLAKRRIPEHCHGMAVRHQAGILHNGFLSQRELLLLGGGQRYEIRMTFTVESMLIEHNSRLRRLASLVEL